MWSVLQCPTFIQQLYFSSLLSVIPVWVILSPAPNLVGGNLARQSTTGSTANPECQGRVLHHVPGVPRESKYLGVGTTGMDLDGLLISPQE